MALFDTFDETNENYCEQCRYTPAGSHYHCANCGEVSSMYGHYNFALHKFTCDA